MLQNLAWKIADQFGWPDTFMAEYIAMTQLQADAFVCMEPALQADAFVCMEPALARVVSGTVTVVSIYDLFSSF